MYRLGLVCALTFSMLGFCLQGCSQKNVVELDLEAARGNTMGTYYRVKVLTSPQKLPEDWKESIDAELRTVNDQMSTYLESSEISRFNASDSTDWFTVSTATAKVVLAAQEISKATDGAFDVTVAPLVNLWSFGPGERRNQPPSEEEIFAAKQIVGYEKLDVRLDPPALKKTIPGLQVDLSAIAKGHGVDRLIELLNGLGCEHAFVDIGGESRASGERGDREWRVAIEDPNFEDQSLQVIVELKNNAIATSGDYRNFFEFEGVKYSHTIDPRTGRPITNGVASVSVVADDCMTADGWATAISVLGKEKGMEIAESLGLAVRVVTRNEDGTFAAVTSSAFPEPFTIAEGVRE